MSPRPEPADASIASVASARSVALLTFRKIRDPRGNLTPVQGLGEIPFEIRRVYWVYDVPGGAGRGGHAHRTLEEVFVAVSGSFDLVVDDGLGAATRHGLNRSYFGLYVPPMRWRRLENFSTNGVCLAFASQHYDADDYIRDFTSYCRLRATVPL